MPAHFLTRAPTFCCPCQLRLIAFVAYSKFIYRFGSISSAFRSLPNIRLNCFLRGKVILAHWLSGFTLQNAEWICSWITQPPSAREYLPVLCQIVCCPSEIFHHYAFHPSWRNFFRSFIHPLLSIPDDHCKDYLSFANEIKQLRTTGKFLLMCVSFDVCNYIKGKVCIKGKSPLMCVIYLKYFFGRNYRYGCQC